MATNSLLKNTIVEENPRGTVLMFSIIKLLTGEPLKAATSATSKFYTFLENFFNSLEVNETETLNKINEDLSSFTRKEKLSDTDEKILLNILKWMREFKPVKDDCVILHVDKSISGTLKLIVENPETYTMVSTISTVFNQIPNRILEDVGKIGYNTFKKQEMIGSSISQIHGKKQFFSILIPNSQIKNILYMLTTLGKASIYEEENVIIIKNNGKIKMDLCMIGVFTEFIPELTINTTDLNKAVVDTYLSKI
jgi:hypothetical protein